MFYPGFFGPRPQQVEIPWAGDGTHSTAAARVAAVTLARSLTCCTTGELHVLDFFFFFLFRVTPVSYGSSQARGHIGATTASLGHNHSNTQSQPLLQPTPQLTATQEPRTEDRTTSSWMLVGFVTPEPQRERPPYAIFAPCFLGFISYDKHFP